MDCPELRYYYMQNRRDHFRTIREMRKLFIRAAYSNAIKRQKESRFHPGSSSTCEESRHSLRTKPFKPNSTMVTIEEEDEEGQEVSYSVANETITFKFDIDKKNKDNVDGKGDEEDEQETFLPKPNSEVNRSYDKNKPKNKDGEEEERKTLLPNVINNKPENKDSEEDEQGSLLPSSDSGSPETDGSTTASDSSTIALVYCIIVLFLMPIIVLALIYLFKKPS